MKTIVHTNKEFVEALILGCEVCYVGMVDTDEMPYVLPMNFGYQDGVVYLHSAREGRSIDILYRNPNVCLVFNPANKLVHQHPDVACSYRMHSKSVIGWGKVVFEESFDSKVEALDIIMKNYSDKQFEYSDPAIDNVKIWCVKLEKVTCKEFGAPHR